MECRVREKRELKYQSRSEEQEENETATDPEEVKKPEYWKEKVLH